MIRKVICRKSKKFFTPVVIMMAILSISFVYFNKTANAADTSSFNAGNIISDSVFYNSNSMSAAEIQNFLNSKVTNCNTNHAGFTGDTGTTYNPPWVCLKGFYENPDSTYTINYNYTDTSGNAQTGSRKYYYNNAYTYTSLSPIYKNGDYKQGIDHLAATIQGGSSIPSGAISAAQIIYNVAQEYGINPQVLIVLLQKEQGLVTDTWPSSWQYQAATGYGCPDYQPCSSNYAGFTKQLASAAWQFKQYQSNPTAYSYVANRNNNILWSPNSTCGSSTVFIQNQATAGLYNYTPYRPNQAALNAGYGSGDGCSAYGNRNFWLYFTDWFGSTYDSVYQGVDYSAVFNATYYLDNNPDVKAAYGNSASAALAHFVNYGIAEGRQAIDSFNVTSYKNRYQDLRIAFGANLRSYYLHYMSCGQKEGRIATGDITIQYITSYNGVDYSDVYNFATYIANNSDIKAIYGNDDAGAIAHFVNYGMNEGRQAINSFSVVSYKNRYPDLRHVFGSNTKSYYLHYISNGQKEGRIATGNEINGISNLNGVEYSAVYNFSTYLSNNPDIKAAFGDDDIAVLKHFINNGMNEGRQAIDSFNVSIYKNNYLDLRLAFNNNLKAYYLHYINCGQKEGRIANTTI